MLTICYLIWSLAAASAAKSKDLDYCIGEEFLILSKLLVVKKKQKVFVYVWHDCSQKFTCWMYICFVLRMLRDQEQTNMLGCDSRFLSKRLGCIL